MILTLAFGLCVAASAPAYAQGSGWFDSYRTFSVYVENDALAKWKGKNSTDETYTQGARLTWDFARWPEWAAKVERRLSLLALRRPADQKMVEGECGPAVTRAFGPCGSVSFGLGQTMYSPADIITPALQRRDQPYAGWLFGTMGLNVRDGRLQSTTEFVLGVVGRASLSEHTQSLAHWTLSNGSPKPGGWAHQLHGSVHAGLMQSYSGHLLEKCRNDKPLVGFRKKCSGGANENRVFDFTPRVELVGTTLMLRASGGVTARYGRRIPDRMGQRIPATGREAGTSSVWWTVFGSADGRLVGYNAFLSGTYADGGANGWRSLRQIEPRRFVNEVAVGAGFGWRLLSFTAQGVSRSLEWDPQVIPGASPKERPRHSFLSLMIGLNYGR